VCCACSPTKPICLSNPHPNCFLGFLSAVSVGAILLQVHLQGDDELFWSASFRAV
jgi:hypothetical protein